MTYDEAKLIFKKNIRSLEIGLHNYCNRTCTFCPLSINSVKRREKKNVKFIADSTYNTILKELSEIDYDGTISYTRYCEPLSHKEFVLDKIKLTRKILPKVNLIISSNSDYVNRDYINELIEAGISQLNLMAYLKNGTVKFSADDAIERINKILKKLEFNNKLKKKFLTYDDYIRVYLPEINTYIIARNYWNNGSNRGGTVINKDFVRKDPCTTFNDRVHIEYNGSMTICCDMLTPELHEKWEVGNLNKNKSLFMNVSSDFYNDWRKRINNANWFKDSPCIKCTRGKSLYNNIEQSNFMVTKDRLFIVKRNN